jgi:hypothetical protein
MEVAFDGVLLLLALIAFVVSQILLESGVKTHVTDAYGHTTEQYYTLSTCYATYSDEVRLTPLLLFSCFGTADFALWFVVVDFQVGLSRCILYLRCLQL